MTPPPVLRNNQAGRAFSQTDAVPHAHTKPLDSTLINSSSSCVGTVGSAAGDTAIWDSTPPPLPPAGPWARTVLLAQKVQPAHPVHLAAHPTVPAPAPTASAPAAPAPAPAPALRQGARARHEGNPLGQPRQLNGKLYRYYALCGVPDADVSQAVARLLRTYSTKLIPGASSVRLLCVFCASAVRLLCVFCGRRLLVRVVWKNGVICCTL